MTGTVRCCKCQKVMDKNTCGCGHTTAYINLYWKGKYVRIWGYGPTNTPMSRERAERQLTVIRSKIEEGTFDPAEYLPHVIKENLFKQRVDEWLAVKIQEELRGELSGGTLKQYKNYASNYFSPALGELDVRLIKYPELEKFKNSLPAELKIKSRKNILNALHALFNWLKKHLIISEVPTFPTIKGDDAEIREAISVGDQLDYLKNIPEEHRDIVEFGYETGLRTAELCALKLKDISLKERRVLIRRTWVGSKLKETTKANHKDFVPLSQRAAEIAQRLIKEALKDDITDFSVLERFMFINPVTKRGYRTEYVRRTWRLYSQSAVTFYEATRHSFCTQVVESGNVDPYTAQRLMRHTDIRTTQKYFHASTQRLLDIVDRRGRLPESHLNQISK